MKKILSVVALVALSGMAKAQDKATEFKFGGEVRTRYYNNMNAYQLRSDGVINESHWEQRNNFTVSANTSDRMKAYFSFMHAAVWGGGKGVPTASGPFDGSGTQVGSPGMSGMHSLSLDTQAFHQNTLLVQEAWVLWRALDNVVLKVGRQSNTWGEGLVLSRNEWNPVPNNLDALMGRVYLGFMDVDFGGGKFYEEGVESPTSATASDKEINLYGLNISINNLPDFLKKVELTYAHLTGDATSLPTSSNVTVPYSLFPGFVTDQSWGLDHYGVSVKGDFAIIDYRIDYGMQNSKTTKTGNATWTALSRFQNTAQSGSMIDADLGVNFPEMMKARFSVGYHTDSGDDSTTTDKNEAYQPLAHDQHKFAGNMNLFGFGNLTNIRIGASVAPSEHTTVSLAYHMLSRTSDKDTVNVLGPNNGNFFALPVQRASSGAGAVSNTADKDLGNELDLSVKHVYGNGLSMLLNYSMFTTGNYFKNLNGGTAGNASQVLAQAQYNF